MKTKRIIVSSFIVLALLLNVKTYAQQANNMYFLKNVPESRFLNPAQTGDYKFYLNLPLIPGINLNVASNPLKYSDLVFFGEGEYADSLITPLHFSADKEAFLEKLSDKNFFGFETDLDLLGFGFRMNDMFFSFDIRTRIQAQLNYPGDLFSFLLGGNQQFVGGDIDLSYLGADALAFHEVSFSVSKSFLDDKLTVGLRPKMVYGIMNLDMQSEQFKIISGGQGEQLSIIANGGIYTNAPLILHYNDQNEIDSVSINSDTQQLISKLYNFSNTGFGIDLGASYQVMDGLNVYASLIDLGVIKWKDEDAKFLEYKASYQFDGINLDQLTDTTSNFADDFLEQIMDSLDYSATSGTYKTALGAKLYIGASYNLTKSIKFGFLSKTNFLDNRITQQFTLSANAQLGKAFSAVASYSVMNNSYTNLGLGFALNAGPWQFYMMTDNVPFFPQHTNNVNLRLGLNVVINEPRAKEPKM